MKKEQNLNSEEIQELNMPIVMPSYYCKVENLNEVLFYIDSAIKGLQKCKEDTIPEQWTLKDIYDQLNSFNGHNGCEYKCSAE